MISVLKKINWKKIFINQSMLFVLILLLIILAFVSDKFFTLNNIFNIFRQTGVLGILACGATIVIICGGIDLSVGSILTLSMLVGIKLLPYGYTVSIIATIITGIVCGLINGILIGKYNGNYFMVTLSTLIIFQGFALLVSGGYNLQGINAEPFTFVGKGNILGIPAIIYVLVFILIISGIFLQKSIFGRRLYAVGINKYAAFAAGINVPNIIAGSYIVSGALTGIAAVVLSSRLVMIQPGAGKPYLFEVVTAVVLGGINLSGGYGNIFKTTLGFLLLGIINNSMAIMGVQYESQQMIKGAVFIIALIYVEFINRKRIYF
jgi:ribose transport system permease protein